MRTTDHLRRSLLKWPVKFKKISFSHITASIQNILHPRKLLPLKVIIMFEFKFIGLYCYLFHDCWLTNIANSALTYLSYSFLLWGRTRTFNLCLATLYFLWLYVHYCCNILKNIYHTAVQFKIISIFYVLSRLSHKKFSHRRAAFS